MMRENTPPRKDDDDDDVIFEDADEVYEVDDIDDLEEMLDSEGAFGDDDGDDNDDDDDDKEDEFPATEVDKILFSGHQGSVFCCEISPCEDIGASGGEDDKAFLFDSKTGNILAQCEGHKDSVTNLSFSHNGMYLATGDMSGYIAVWKVQTFGKVWEFETDDLNWMIWHPSSNILFAGTRTGDIWMWLMPRGDTRPLTHAGVSSECGALTRDGKRLCSGFVDGSIKIIDLKNCKTLHSISCHSQPVTSLSAHPQHDLILSGSMDETSKLLNSNSGKVLSTFTFTPSSSQNSESNSNDDEFSNSVEVVSFCPIIADLATSRHHIVQGCGTSSILWHPKEPHFISCGLDGNLRVYDVRSGNQLYKFKGDNSSVLSCHINKEGSKVIFSSDKGTVTVLNIGSLYS
ncbi:Angio-associated migratory cell protein [Armadillidium vulgare]|nr:Angio-associated migratory cell protein [Armadillidium vulgare]